MSGATCQRPAPICLALRESALLAWVHSCGRDRTPQNQKSLAGELLRGRSNNLVPPLTTTKSMTANDAASKTLKKGFLLISQ